MKTSAKLVAALVALCVGAGTAMAANSHVASGKLERINPKSITVDHKTYRYDTKLAGRDLKTGQSVQVTYHWGHGHRVADKVMPGAV